MTEIPIPVLLGIVATLGYMFGRSQLRQQRQELKKPSQYELKRAQAVVRDLESVSNQVRTSLAKHQASLVEFKNRVTELSKSPNADACAELASQAERVLKPTQTLSNQISHAYDEIRQQTNLLMSFTELRTDPLTGLTNRRTMDDTLAGRFAMMARYNALFSLVIFDVDNFKQINDREGHVHGDEVLQAIARAIQDNARETDVVTRYGGEEFVVICPETDLSGACLFAERTRKAIERDLKVTISSGAAMALDGDTARSLLARADSALYSAKAGGRNCVYQHTGHHILPFAVHSPQRATPAARITASDTPREAADEVPADEVPPRLKKSFARLES